MNDKYWAEFYKTWNESGPSDFCKWVTSKLMTDEYICDFGCGNGRDTYWLNFFVPTLGIDPQAPDDVPFVRMTAQEYMSKTASRANVTTYARWFLHAVEEEVEDQLLDWTQGRLLIETRVVGDVVDDTHERRLIDPDVLMGKLRTLNYDVQYYEISDSFSYDNPLLLRVDAHRKEGA